MAGRLEGKVAFITGAARGQGRSHAIRLAEEGADIIAIDVCQDIASVPYALATAADLRDTVKQVESKDRRIVATHADVRDYEQLRAALDAGVAELGRLDIVSANAGIASYGRLEKIDSQMWQDMINVNLTGVWHTAKASIPHLRAAGGGAIVLTSSTAGLKGFENVGHYAAAKHGLVGLMRSLALELAHDGIRVNTIHPTSVDTNMIQNEATHELFTPGLAREERTQDALAASFQSTNLIQVPWIEAVDISHALVWLASDEARYVTGVTLPVDAGLLIK
jgi:SDR family mycofactocin-dependent oxidoreductase